MRLQRPLRSTRDGCAATAHGPRGSERPASGHRRRGRPVARRRTTSRVSYRGALLSRGPTRLTTPRAPHAPGRPSPCLFHRTFPQRWKTQRRGPPTTETRPGYAPRGEGGLEDSTAVFHTARVRRGLDVLSVVKSLGQRGWTPRILPARPA